MPKLSFFAFLVFFGKAVLAADSIILAKVEAVAPDEARGNAKFDFHPGRWDLASLTLFKRWPANPPRISRVIPVSGPLVAEIRRLHSERNLRYQLNENQISQMAGAIKIVLYPLRADRRAGIQSLKFNVRRQRFVHHSLETYEKEVEVTEELVAESALPALAALPLEQVVSLNVPKDVIRARVLHCNGSQCFLIPETNLIRWMAGFENDLTLLPVEPHFLNVEDLDKDLLWLNRSAQKRSKYPAEDPFADNPYFSTSLLEQREYNELRNRSNGDRKLFKRLAKKATRERAKAESERQNRVQQKIFSAIPDRIELWFDPPHRMNISSWLPRVLEHIGVGPSLPIERLLPVPRTLQNCVHLIAQSEEPATN